MTTTMLAVLCAAECVFLSCCAACCVAAVYSNRKETRHEP